MPDYCKIFNKAKTVLSWFLEDNELISAKSAVQILSLNLA